MRTNELRTNEFGETNEELKAEEMRSKMIRDCIDNNPDFAWRWRIIKSANRKIPYMIHSADPVEVKKGKSLQRRINHLEKWCQEYLEEEASALAEAELLATDTYAYYGVRRSDFI
jgi:hypothetical protein